MWKQLERKQFFIKIHFEKMIVKIKILNKYLQCTIFLQAHFLYHITPSLIL